MYKRITQEFITNLRKQNINKSPIKSILNGLSINAVEIRTHNKYSIVDLSCDGNHHYGFAVCSVDDKYSRRTGIAIAYRRAFVKLERSILKKCKYIIITV